MKAWVQGCGVKVVGVKAKGAGLWCEGCECRVVVVKAVGAGLWV